VNSSDPHALAAARQACEQTPAAPEQAPLARPSGAARARFRDAKAARLAQFLATRPTARAALRLLRGLSNDVDATLRDLWSEAGMPADTALVAVGGYGRGELFPYSDIDVLVLLPSVGLAADNDARDSAIERFIGACWDSGLEIGSSVRTVDECVTMALADVTVQTAMLESRYLSGARKVFKAFEHAIAAAMDPKAFLAPRRRDAKRHQKYEHALLVEPNCKGKPGRAADLQTVIWSRARGRPGHLGRSSRARPITPFGVRQLQRNGGMPAIRARLARRAARGSAGVRLRAARVRVGYRRSAGSAPGA
jgi:[protein-PII] uridylyltransferase